MITFNEEHKKEMKMNSDFTYFDYGVHQVKLVTFVQEKSPDGKVYIEVFFESMDGEREESKRQYMTSDKAIWYARNLFKSLFIGAAPDNFKAAAEKTFNEAKTSTEMVKLLNEKLPGKTAWINKYPSPDRTMANGKPAPEVSLSATEPKSRMVEEAEKVFESTEKSIDAWGK